MFLEYLVNNLINFLFFGQNRYLELSDWNTQQAIHDALEDIEWEQVQDTVQCTVPSSSTAATDNAAVEIFMKDQFHVQVVDNVYIDENEDVDVVQRCGGGGGGGSNDDRKGHKIADCFRFFPQTRMSAMEMTSSFTDNGRSASLFHPKSDFVGRQGREKMATTTTTATTRATTITAVDVELATTTTTTSSSTVVRSPSSTCRFDSFRRHSSTSPLMEPLLRHHQGM
jgi:hypothetical protein